MQKYYIEEHIETLEELNPKTCIIKKNNKIYIRLDDEAGKGEPSDWRYSDYFPVYKEAENYAKYLADRTDTVFYIYMKYDTEMFYVFPKTEGNYYAYKDESKFISKVEPEDKLYIFEIHHHSYRTGQKYSTEVGIMKARNEDKAKEKIWEKYGGDNSSFHDDEIEEIPKEWDTQTIKVLLQGS